MIPLAWLLIAWVACVCVFLLVALLTVTLALKFALSGPRTLFFCSGFLFVSFLVIGTVSLFAMRVDWSQSLSFTPTSFAPSLLQL
ncbi:hypothetical protein KBB27_04355 [Patescibacteria group bacterium]|nr:hypothetical protein [Patescibacteria group bacterium]